MKSCFSVFIALLPAVGCAAEPASLDQQLGWLHGQCLAIKNAGLVAGSKVQLVLLDEPQTTISGTVESKVTDSSQCFALMDDRRKVNQAAGYQFYRVATTEPVELAIGRVSDEQIRLTEPDLRNAHFSYCSTGEGVQFSVWPVQAYQDKPLWRGYYYTGYDTEADCPE
ncbi:hypothetical protein QCD60_12520 [Pokkaliibacter sp. MBI-7]|uniref:hypothetical protein n=1 Tax=Pokkaliibacter sp. MBI-7 TaxID=3040600 RepID=UPI00244BF933|nr:hypothetical protein [Pokkaliibacter sp. MBI-7]MDH2433396.1 hypothetical protein [Pokkaliibacter sp. MBI-7]